MTHICPACEIGELVARRGDTTIQYNGEPLLVRDTYFSECQSCGEEVVLHDQSKLNEILFSDAKKEKEGLWSCSGIASFRDFWGLSQQEAASIFGGGTNAFSKYERGEVIHSRSMDLLMRVFNEFSDVRMYLGQRVGFDRWASEQWQPVVEAAECLPKSSRSTRDIVISLEAFRSRVKEVQASAANEEWEDELSYGTP